MRFAGRGFWLLGAFVFLMAVAFAGCENPFSPIDKSEKIQGLTYIDFSLSWSRWDSDPEYDGLEVTIDYYGEFGDALSFTDKPHDVTIEFWSQKEETTESGDDTTTTTTTTKTYDTLFYTLTVDHKNSSDTIRIPIESYIGDMKGASDFVETADYNAFVIVRVHPPQDYPKSELVVGYSDMLIYKPVENDVTPNG